MERNTTMATYKVRGASHNVIYSYRTSTGQTKQQWESYDTELEAVQRKAYIELLQSQKRTDELRQAALDYGPVDKSPKHPIPMV